MTYREEHISESSPFIKEHSAFPLRDAYKKPVSVLRVEQDGSVFSYTSPETMNVYLSLEYGRLYLKSVFTDDGEKITCHEYNTELAYTGEMIASDEGRLVFDEGRLVREKESPKKVNLAIRGYLSVPHKEPDDREVSEFVHEFCTELCEIEHERKAYVEDLSQFLSGQIQKHNDGIASEERDTERMRQYVYSDHMLVYDEYQTAMGIILSFAEKWFGILCSEYSDRSYVGYYESEHTRCLSRHMRASLSREELCAALKVCTECGAPEKNAEIACDKMKDVFVKLMKLITYRIAKIPAPRKRTRRLRDYLDD